MKFRSYLASVSLSAMVLVAPTVAQAQDNSGEIIVTAQRRPERLQNVPVSVTAVSSDVLKARGLNDLTQMTLAAPSLQSGADNNFAVRGVGTSAFSSSIESSVAYAQDEVNLTNAGLIYSFFDLAQVEVLNGPQGLLFGRNASAGLLNVSSAKPQLGKTSGQFDLELDRRPTAANNSNGIIARGAVNLPLGDKAALRLAGFNEYQMPLVNFSGALNNGARNELNLRRFGLRASLLFKPSEALTFTVIGDVGQDRGVLGLFDSTYRQLGAGSANLAQLASAGITASPGNITVAGNAGYYRDVDRNGLQAKASYLLDNGIEISNIVAWKGFTRKQQLDTDGTGSNGADFNRSSTSFNQFSNELRIALPGENRLSGQAGIYAFRSTLKEVAQIAGNNYFPSFLLPRYPFCVGATAVAGAGAGVCSVSNGYFLGFDRVVRQTNDGLAAFGQLTYKLTDKLQLIGGARVTQDIVSIRLVQNQQKYFVTFGIVEPGRSERVSNTNFSYKLGAQYNLTRDVMAYGTYGRGYKGPGFNNNAVSASASLAIKPETNENVEIGLKTSWLQRKLIVNLSAFQSNFSNYQIQSFDLSSSSFVTQNAATVKSKGAELTITARPLRGLTISTNATLLDSKFGNFPGAQCYPGQGCTTYNAAGRTTPLAPKFTGTVDVNYEFNSSHAVRPFVGVNFYHRSSMNFTTQPYPGTTFGQSNIWGGTLGLRADNWRASVFCKNCTDQRVPGALGLESGDGNAGIATVTQRFGQNSFRTIGLQLGFNF
ncbi:TonB-dependent receptor [Novosphingobium umbonatum]|uniref:TonB-dependent receptor n=1 Tax=Novosphingobium umbonatum TaxID=1908524 RepID=A0A3S2VTW1_9SPHN|nr:TonB-dependent receptor [Novosphingobium umbonatum]RVU05666.1 TonB-dependent receptor [Novosphingobium umbonatum]